MSSFDTILSSFQKLSVKSTEYYSDSDEEHEGVKEYDDLLANIEALKKCNYTKNLASKLHIKNKHYFESIVFISTDSGQMEIKEQLTKCLEINYRTEHILYCLKTKKILNNILAYLNR
jgi:hypothetical protein